MELPWIKLVKEDLLYISKYDRLSALADPALHGRALWDLLQSSKHLFKVAMKNLIDYTGTLKPEPPKTANVDEMPLAELHSLEEHNFVCFLCSPGESRVFSTRKAFTSHRLKAHGIRSIAEAFLQGEAVECPHCSKVFPNHRKLVDHVMYRTKFCYIAIIPNEHRTK